MPYATSAGALRSGRTRDPFVGEGGEEWREMKEKLDGLKSAMSTASISVRSRRDLSAISARSRRDLVSDLGAISAHIDERFELAQQRGAALGPRLGLAQR